MEDNIHCLPLLAIAAQPHSAPHRPVFPLRPLRLALSLQFHSIAYLLVGTLGNEMDFLLTRHVYLMRNAQLSVSYSHRATLVIQ